jgi:rod shape-determining protein MreC
MRNLLLFIWKYSFFFSFLLLESFCFYLVAKNNHYQQASVLNSTNRSAASVLKVRSDAEQYLYLKEENDKLAKENAVLWNHSLVSFSKIDDKQFEIVDTIYRQKYSYISSKIVNNSINRRNNMLTLNRGSNDGVSSDMAVICSNGVVGVVKDVSPNYCTVISLLHGSLSISAKIQKNGYIGPLEWDGTDHKYATLKDIPVHVALQKGNIIVTSAYSLSFPENVMIGTVESFQTKLGEFSYSVKVRLSTDFQKLSHVYIVNNLQRTEQETLEQKSMEDVQ